MAAFVWEYHHTTAPDVLLHALADQLLLVEEILRQPDEARQGHDFTLTAPAAAGLSIVVSSIESALRELAAVLGTHPRGARPALVQAFQDYIHAFPDTQSYLTKLFVAARRQQFVEWNALHQACCCETCLSAEGPTDNAAAAGAAD